MIQDQFNLHVINFLTRILDFNSNLKILIIKKNRMKRIIIFFVIFFVKAMNINGQELKSNDDYLYLAVGRGYIDGIIPLDKIPTLTIGYEREINQFFNIGVSIHSFYRSMPDSYTLDDANGHPVMDILIEGAYGPFITSKDIQKIKNVGIKDLDASWTIKEFTLPVTVFLKLKPTIRKISFGGLLGFGMCYINANYWKDFQPISRILLNDGTEYTDIQLSQQTHFRSLDPFIENIAVFCEYNFKNFNLGLNFGEYGLLLGNSYQSLNWNFSLFAKLKL